MNRLKLKVMFTACPSRLSDLLPALHPSYLNGYYPRYSTTDHWIQESIKQIQFQIQIFPPFSIRFQKFPKVPKVNKQTQFKTSEDPIRAKQIVNVVVFLKEKYNYIIIQTKIQILPMIKKGPLFFSYLLPKLGINRTDTLPKTVFLLNILFQAFRNCARNINFQAFTNCARKDEKEIYFPYWNL